MDYELSMLKELVSLDTDSVEKRNYTEISKILRDNLKDIGARVEIIYAKAPDGRPRPNVIGYIDNGKDETVGFSSHFDIVPVVGQNWKRDPFKLHVSGGRAFGRGSSDDKSGIVISMAAAKDAKSKVNVELMYSCDEEVGSTYGAGWVLKNMRKKIRSNHVVVLDTEKEVTVGGSGVSQGRITIAGKGVHAGFPFMGRNAIEIALPFLSRIKQFDKIAGRDVSRCASVSGHEIYGRFSLTVLHSGSKENIIPGSLQAGFDMRSIPERSVSELIEKFKVYFNRTKKEMGVDAKLEFLAFLDSYMTDPKAKIVNKLMAVTGKRRLYGTFGGNDGTYFSGAGIPAVAYGCINETCHLANEYVSVKELMQVKNEMIRLLETF